MPPRCGPDGWDVWDAWTPERRDFNPTHPDRFPGAQRVDAMTLPAEIAAHTWPAEYLDT